MNKQKLMKLYVLMWCLVIISCIEIVSVHAAQTEVYKPYTPINLQFRCTLNGAIPSPSTTFNISLYYQNGSVYVNNTQTAAQGSGSFNYTVTFPSTETYEVKMFCTDGTNSFSDEGYYIITPTGTQLSTSQSVTYILIFIVSLIIFAGLLLAGIYIPKDNRRDQFTGYIIAVENTKYIKYLCIMFAYLVALFIAFFSYSMCFSYLDFPYMANILYFILQTG